MSNLYGPRVTPSDLCIEIERHENYLAVVSFLGRVSKRSLRKREQYIRDLKAELFRITATDDPQTEMSDQEILDELAK